MTDMDVLEIRCHNLAWSMLRQHSSSAGVLYGYTKTHCAHASVYQMIVLAEDTSALAALEAQCNVKRGKRNDKGTF